MKEGIPHINSEVFNPESELKRLRRVRRSDTSPEPERKREHIASRRASLEDFKEKLAVQKEKLAEIQTKTTEYIRQNPDDSYEELYKYAINQAKVSAADKEQKTLIKQALREYVKKHAALRELREKFANNKEIFAELFGTNPLGKIDIVFGPANLYIRCFDVRDFLSANACHEELFEEKRSEDEIKDCGGSAIFIKGRPELGTVTLENSSLNRSEEKFQQVRAHEEQHVIYKLFQRTGNRFLLQEALEELEKENDETGKEAILEKILRVQKESLEDNIKDEILAYGIIGYSSDDIIRALTSDDLYGLRDFSKRKSFFFEQYGHFVSGDSFERAWEKSDIESAKELLRDGALSYERLLQSGYSAQKAVALLTHEPLSRWTKVVRRMTEKGSG